LVAAGLLAAQAARLLLAEFSPAIAAGVVAVFCSLPFGWAVASSASGARPFPLGPSWLVLAGAGWPAAALLHWTRTRTPIIPFREGSWVELLALLFCLLDGAAVVIKRSISLWDSLFLGSALSLYILFALRLEPPSVRTPAAQLPGRFPWRQAALGAMACFSGLLLLGSWASLSKLAGSSVWLQPLAEQAPALATGLCLVAIGESALGLRVLVATQILLGCLWSALAPAAALFSRGRAHIPLSPAEAADLVGSLGVCFFAFLHLSGLALSVSGAATMALLFAATVVLRGPSGSWLAGALGAAACAALVAKRRMRSKES